MLPLTPDQLRHLRERIAARGLDPIADRVEAAAQGAITLVTAEPEDYARVGNTRIGGVPDLPPDLPWPTVGGRFLVFLAQINLAELPPVEGNPLPPHGMLSFFLGEEEEITDVKHRVLFWQGDPSRLRRAEAPDPALSACERSAYEGFRVALHRTISLPDWASEDYRRMIQGVDDEEIDDFVDAFDDMHHNIRVERELIDPTQGRPVSPHQVLGYPLLIEHDPARFAYLRSVGRSTVLFMTSGSLDWSLQLAETGLRDALAAQDPKDADRWRKHLEDLHWFRDNHPRIPEGMSNWRLLFELNSDDNPGMCWWDAGRLHFLIHRDDLRAARFDRTYCGIVTA